MAGFFKPKNEEGPVSVPRELPILPLRDSVVFPFSVIPLAVGIPRSVKLVEEAMQGDSLVGLFASKDKDVEEPLPGQVNETGTMARILRVVRGQERLAEPARGRDVPGCGSPRAGRESAMHDQANPDRRRTEQKEGK